MREKVAFSPNDIEGAVQKLITHPGINAAVILSTCNRLEIYVSSTKHSIKHLLASFLAEFHGLKANELEEYLDYFENESLVQHICAVASGLHSLVLGEPQILGQLKEAYNISKQHNYLDKFLEKLFQHTFFVAKQVRSTTDIGKNPVSVAYCGIKLSEKIFSDISKQTALLVGAGEMIELSAKHLAQKNIKHIIIANRTLANAEHIAEQLTHSSVEVISLKQLAEHFHRADIVVSSTAAPVAIIGKGLVESSVKERKHKPLFILDIAIPRDVESQVAELDDVFLYTVDDLQQVVSDNEQARSEAKVIALQKVDELSQEFISYFSSANNEEIVKEYYQNAHALKTEILHKALAELRQSADEDANKKVLTKLADQLTNKLLHQNLTTIKTANSAQLLQCSKCIPIITNE